MIMPSMLLWLSLLLFQQSPATLLECTADTWIDAAAEKPHGREETLALEEGRTALLAFRTAAVEGWKIEKAVLLLHLAHGSAPDKVQVAAIRGVWTEGTTALPELSPFEEAPVKTKPDGWISIALPPAWIDRKSTGIALRVTKQLFNSRESGQFTPFLAVQRR